MRVYIDGEDDNRGVLVPEVSLTMSSHCFTDQ